MQFFPAPGPAPGLTSAVGAAARRVRSARSKLVALAADAVVLLLVGMIVANFLA